MELPDLLNASNGHFVLQSAEFDDSDFSEHTAELIAGCFNVVYSIENSSEPVVFKPPAFTFFDPSERALHALFFYASQASRSLDNLPRAFDIAIESHADLAADLSVMFKATAVMYGVQPDCMHDAWPVAEAVLEAAGVTLIPEIKAASRNPSKAAENVVFVSKDAKKH